MSEESKSEATLRERVEALAAKWDKESDYLGARISYRGAASAVMKEHAADLRAALSAPPRDPEAPSHVFDTRESRWICHPSPCPEHAATNSSKEAK